MATFTKFPTSTAGSGPDWYAPERIKADDNSYTDIRPLSSAYTPYLIGSGYGFNIPLNATITGVEVSVAGYADQSSQVQFDKIALKSSSGATIGTVKSNTTYLTTSEAVYTFGGPTDLWGAALTPAMVNDPTFGAGISMYHRNGYQYEYIDYIKVSVHFTDPTVYPSTTSNGSTATTDNSGLYRWFNPTNALVRDGVFATQSSSPVNTENDYLRVTGFNFNTIPAGSTILGIAVNTRTRIPSATNVVRRMVNVQLTKNGTTRIGQDLGTPNEPWSSQSGAVDVDTTYGSPYDLWGTTWTLAELQSPTFGVHLRAKALSTTNSVDHVSITVFYAGPAKVDTIITEDASTSYTLTHQDANVTQSDRTAATTAEFTMSSGDHTIVNQLVDRISVDTTAYQMSSGPATIVTPSFIKVDTASYSMTANPALVKATEVIKAETTKYVMSSDNHNTGGASTIQATTAAFKMESGVHGARAYGTEPVKQGSTSAFAGLVEEGPGDQPVFWEGYNYATGAPASDPAGGASYAGWGNNFVKNYPATSNYLMLTNLGLASVLPPLSRVTGITIVVSKFDTYGAAVDAGVYLIRRTGSRTMDVLSGNRAKAGKWPQYSGVPLPTVTYGGPTDMWESSIKTSDLLDPNFGLALQVTMPYQTRCSVDAATFLINYEISGRTASVTVNATASLSSGTGQTWLDATNAWGPSDNLNAVANGGGGGVGQYLPSQNLVLNSLKTASTPLAIPSIAIISGIELFVYGSTYVPYANGYYYAPTDREVYLVKRVDSTVTRYGSNKAIVPANQGKTAGFPGDRINRVYGGPNDTWGAALTPAFVNDPAFGISFAANVPNGGDIRVDSIAVKVYYTIPVQGIRADSTSFVMVTQAAQVNQMTRMNAETTAYQMSETNHVVGIFKRLTVGINEQSTLEALIKRRRSSSIVPIAEHATVSNMAAGRNRKVISLNTNRSTVALGNTTRVRNPVVTINETSHLSTATQRRRRLTEQLQANAVITVKTKRHRKIDTAIAEQVQITARMGRLLDSGFQYSGKSGDANGQFVRTRKMPTTVAERVTMNAMIYRARVAGVTINEKSGWFISPIKGILKEFALSMLEASNMSIDSGTMRIRGNQVAVAEQTKVNVVSNRVRQSPVQINEQMTLATKANRKRLVTDNINVTSAITEQFNRSRDVSGAIGEHSTVDVVAGRTRETPFSIEGQITWSNDFIRSVRAFGVNVEQDAEVNFLLGSAKLLGVTMPGNSNFIFGPLINTKTLEMAPISNNMTLSAEFARFRTAAAEFVIETEVNLAIERIVAFAASVQGTVETEIDLVRARELIALVAEHSGLVINTEVLPYQNVIVVKITEYKEVEVNGVIKIKKEVTTGNVTKIEYLKIQVNSLDDL